MYAADLVLEQKEGPSVSNVRSAARQNKPCTAQAI